MSDISTGNNTIDLHTDAGGSFSFEIPAAKALLSMRKFCGETTLAAAFLAVLPLAVWGWSIPSTLEDTIPPPTSQGLSRRILFKTATVAVASTIPAYNLLIPLTAHADDASTASPLLYKRQQATKPSPVSYQIFLPSASMKESSKPVKTHLDEVNFSSETVKGYQYGVTVDPVRISTIQEFGTPEEVAARVVTAEVNRDGVFEVTLLQDPYQVTDDNKESAYILEYVSDGKRGKKVLLNKICVSSDKLLYVLTAQCKFDNYQELKEEMKRTVNSFQVV